MRSSTIGCALGCGHVNGTRPIVFAVFARSKVSPSKTNAKGFVLKHPTHSGNRASPPKEHSTSSKSHRGHARPSHAVTTAPAGSAYVSSSVAQYIRVCFPERASIARRRKRAHRPHRENGGADANFADALGSNLSSNRASTFAMFATKCAYFAANCASACATTAAWSAAPVATKSSCFSIARRVAGDASSTSTASYPATSAPPRSVTSTARLFWSIATYRRFSTLWM